MRCIPIFALIILLWQISLIYQFSVLNQHSISQGNKKSQVPTSSRIPIAVIKEMKSSPSPQIIAPSPSPKVIAPTSIIEKAPIHPYQPYSNVHAFYYGWYGNPSTNSEWLHWNHEVLPDWRDKNPPPPKRFQPPEDIGANYYPELGPYSSADPVVMETHAKQMAQSGIGNAVVSWYPLDKSDEQLKNIPGYSDSLVREMLRIFPKYNVQVSIHLEPYESRNENSVRNDIEYIIDNYSGPGLYKDKSNKPIIYIYDSYHTPAKSWARLLSPEGDISIRNTKYDCTVIALYLEKNDEKLITEGGFDGFYTYFGAVGFTFGSTPSNWDYLSRFANENGKIFIPSVSPGYVDTRIRPWNKINERSRNNGKYYDEMWSSAIECTPDFVSITSFNEWHEGSQIEPVQPYQSTSFLYDDYSPHPPNYYLSRTKLWSDKLNKMN